MPSAATITAFYSFTANTKAKASQVNTNFSNFRGHIVAIDPNTTTAINETYDLGSTEYRWRTGYFRDVDFKSNTSTGQALQIVGDTAAGQGAFLIKHGGSVRARIGGGNQYIDINTTTSQFDFKYNGSTVASINTSGLKYTSLTKATLYSSNITISTFITTTASTLGSLSITSNGLNMMVGLNLTPATPFNLNGQTTTVIPIATYYLYRDLITTTSLLFSFEQAGEAKNTTTSNGTYNELRQLFCIDTSCTSGNHTYYLMAKVNSYPSTILGNASGISYFQAKEVL